MAVSKEYRAAIEARLSSFRPIISRSMFGGVGLYAEDVIFAILDNDRLWFKVDQVNQPAFEEAGSRQWQYAPDAPPMGYFELPASVYDDDSELATWMEGSIAAALRKKASSKPKKRK